MCYYGYDRKKPLFPTQSSLRSRIIGPTPRWRIPSHFNVIHTGSEFCHHCACRYLLSRYNADHNLGHFVKVSFDIYYFDQAPCNQMRVILNHGDVMKWKHFPRYWSFVRGIHRSPVNSPHKGQWRGTLMFSLICSWINGWVSNREAGDLRRHRAHYDVIVMMG